MEMAQRSFLDRSPMAMEMHLSEPQASFLHGHVRAFMAHQAWPCFIGLVLVNTVGQ